LIAATLTGDFEKLDKIEFDRIKIILKPSSGTKKPSIEVIKSKKLDVPFYDIAYELRRSQKDPPLKFDLDALEQERFYRGAPPRTLRERMIRDHFLDVRRQLEEFVNVSWLSVHRQNEESQTIEERKSIPPIDQKLLSLNNALVKHFSSLSRKFSDNIIEFQKRTLLSVITSERTEALFAFSDRIDVDREKKALAGIFEVLGVEEKHYAQKIRSHFDKFNQAIKSREQNHGKISIDQFAAIYNTWRSHSLVQDYEALQMKKIEIFRSRDIFLEVLNNLLGGRKSVSLSERSELVFETKSGKRIPLNELSSGEKQLLIILGEALLQQEMSVIYIADEPELSLHLNWQEALTSSIAKLNHNAQIIFATHSPDIVAGLSDKIINMEDVVQ
jgi:predicted ATP-binding protein involved in virulence